MKKKLLILLAAITLLTCCSQATVLTFGPACPGCQMPAGYGGFTWDANFYVFSNNGYASSPYFNSYGAPSGAAAYNGFGPADVTMSSATPFNFDGADFAGLAQHDMSSSLTSSTITIFGYDASNNLVGTATASLSPSGYNFVSANFVGVSSLVFQSSGTGKYWLMDQFTYNTAAPSVPEPSSLLLLLGVGITSSMGLRKRFR